MKTQTRTTFFSALAIIGLVAAFLFGTWFGGGSNDSDGHDDHDAAIAEAASGAETIWTCSMHPQVRQPNPGQCPICGMDLIPTTSDDDADDDSDLPRLRVSERAAALMNIQTWPVERRTVEREVRLLGSVNYDETRVRTVTAWIPGRLDQLFVNVEGASIEQGDPVAEIYSPSLISAQEELIQALRTARGRETDDSPMVSAARERLRLLGLEMEQIRQIEEEGTVQDRITVNSPLNGVITERIAVEGSYVQVGDRIAVLAALDRVYVDLEAYERDLPWLAEGQAVRFSVEGLAGESFEGRINQINPFVDRGRRTAQIRVLVENPDGMLKPGMFARGVVTSLMGGAEGLPQWREELPLVIPATAALITGRRAVVYVKIADTDRPTFELRQVTLGPRAGDGYIVREGVSEGELVVTNGNFKIDSELQLRGRPSMMAPEGEAPPVHDHGTVAGGPPEPPRRSDFAEDIDSAFAAEIEPLIAAYLELAEGLSSDDETAARGGLAKLSDQLVEIGQHRLSGEAHVSWMEHYNALQTIISVMADQSNIEGLRNHLQSLTDEVERIYIDFGRGILPGLQRAYCPMALNDRGATWLQQSNQNIYNPYFGASMLRCGEILPWDAEDDIP